MPKHLFYLPIIMLGLLGCSSITNKNESLSQEIKEEDTFRAPISKNIYIDLPEVWPLQSPGKYLQKLTVERNHHKSTLSLHLDIQPEQLNTVAFNEIQGKMYQINLSPQKFTWNSSPHLSSNLKPEYILADFFASNLPIQQLQKSLKGGTVEEITEGDKVIRLIRNQENKLVRKITASERIGSLWQKLIIENPEHRYTLVVQTEFAS
ncbi:MAG: hypothetical protein K0S74_390 [Chlamydiales bacterium]|jgi:hypothetical protein|nr:hypothetical protein [Chlamydiales bacterium]